MSARPMIPRPAARGAQPMAPAPALPRGQGLLSPEAMAAAPVPDASAPEAERNEPMAAPEGTSVYPRLSLGPQQRHASKGAYILRVDGPQPVVEVDWTVP
jgi:hypothetical protein